MPAKTTTKKTSPASPKKTAPVPTVAPVAVKQKPLANIKNPVAPELRMTPPSIVRTNEPKKHDDGDSWAMVWVLAPAILAAGAWWWSLARLVSNTGGPLSTSIVWWLVCGAIVSFSLMVGTILLPPFVLTRRRWMILSPVMVVLPAWIFFPPDWPVVAASAALLVGLWAASEGIRREQGSRLRLDIRSGLAHVMMWVVLAGSVSVAVLFFAHTESATSPANNVAKTVEALTRVIERYAPTYVKNYQPTMTIDELLGAQLPTADSLLKSADTNGPFSPDDRQSILDQLAAKGFSDVTVPTAGIDRAAAKQELQKTLDASRTELVKNLRDGVSRQLGFTLRGDETVHQALTDFLTLRLAARNTIIVKLIPPILSIGLLVALRVLSPLFEMLAVGCGWAWYGLLRWLRILKVRAVPVMAERLTWMGPN